MAEMNEIGAFFKKVQTPCEIIVALHTNFNNVEKFLHNSSYIQDAQYVIFIEDTPENANRIASVSRNGLDIGEETPHIRFRLTFYDRKINGALELEHISPCAPELCKELDAWASGLFSQVAGKTMIVKL